MTRKRDTCDGIPASTHNGWKWSENIAWADVRQTAKLTSGKVGRRCLSRCHLVAFLVGVVGCEVIGLRGSEHLVSAFSWIWCYAGFEERGSSDLKFRACVVFVYCDHQISRQWRRGHHQTFLGVRLLEILDGGIQTHGKCDCFHSSNNRRVTHWRSVGSR